MRNSQPALKIVPTALAAALIGKRLLRGSRIRPRQVAVITGGSTGLGLALAHRFGSVGLKLVLAAPVLSADAHYAADRIFNAVNLGRAEITITPQAWLAARFAGLAPETTQAVCALMCTYALPDPVSPTPTVFPSLTSGL